MARSTGPTPEHSCAEPLEAGAADQEAMVGFEQEYTLFDGDEPLGFNDGNTPGPQGPYYCGVGAHRVFGRELVEVHTEACLEAGLMVYGVNAEVMPGQWEFQIGYRGFEGDDNDVLTCTDHLWLAGWLLHRLGEEFGIRVSFDNKPKKGDWNGAGCHTNVSTKAMRAPGGLDVINAAIVRLEEKHQAHVAVYGHDNDQRLTGDHEHVPSMNSVQVCRPWRIHPNSIGSQQKRIWLFGRPSSWCQFGPIPSYSTLVNHHL